jgi:hypothetical protein
VQWRCSSNEHLESQNLNDISHAVPVCRSQTALIEVFVLKSVPSPPGLCVCVQVGSSIYSALAAGLAVLGTHVVQLVVYDLGGGYETAHAHPIPSHVACRRVANPIPCPRPECAILLVNLLVSFSFTAVRERQGEAK